MGTDPRVVVTTTPKPIKIIRAIDPAVSTGEDADETGIIVAGKDANGHGYAVIAKYYSQFANGIVSSVSFVSTTNTARSLAGFVLML